jgi:hypothetical protein
VSPFSGCCRSRSIRRRICNGSPYRDATIADTSAVSEGALVAHSFRTGTDWAAKGKDVIRLQHPIVRNPGHDYALRKNGCRHRRLRAATASGYPIRPASSVFRIPVTGTSRWRRVASHGLSLMSAIPPIVSSGIDTRPRGRGILSSPVAKRMKRLGYSGYRFPPGIIYQAIWLYLRFTLSLRDFEDLLAARGVALSYETEQGSACGRPSRGLELGQAQPEEPAGN